MNHLTTRRDLLVAGGLTLLATAMSVPIAEAKSAPATAREKANIDLVKRYIASCNVKPFDIDGIVATYFAADAIVRWSDDSPPAVGAAAALAAAKPMMPEGSGLEIKLLDIFARGQLVVTSRIDTMKFPGKPDVAFDVAGVHIIKDGKFIEYTDYIVK